MEGLENRNAFGYFEDDKLKDGVRVELSQFFQMEFGDTVSDAHSEALRKLVLLGRAINYLGFLEIREKHGLVYSLGTFIDSLTPGWYNTGLYFDCEKGKVHETLKRVDELLSVTLPAFLKSQKAKVWLADTISSYVFPTNINYNPDYAKGKARDIFYKIGIVYGTRNLIRIFKSITVKDLQDFYEELIKDAKWKLWITSPYKKTEITDLIKDTQIYTNAKKRRLSLRH